MRALLLAAGFGTRLRPLTETIPKCLVPIGDGVLLDAWLKLLTEGGIDRVLINTHYMANAVEEHVRNGPWHNVVEIVHEPVLLGTGGTVLANRTFFGDDAFIVAHADNLTWFDVLDFTVRHKDRPANAIMTMMTFDADDPSSCGIVEIDEAGLVIGFHEKQPDPPGRLANGAVYVFEPSVFEILQCLGEPPLDISTGLLPQCIGRVCTWHNDVYLRDIGTEANLAAARLDAGHDPHIRSLLENTPQ